MTARAAILIAWAVAACTADATVLDDPAGVVFDCDGAWAAGVPGGACALDAPCDRPSPVDPLCCTDYAYCTDRGLVIDTVCDPACACQSDAECTYGAQICNGVRCEACPPPDVCPPCPDGWTRLLRNGCESCQCAPPGDCQLPGDLCPDQVSTCYAGGSCAEMCDPFTPGCCDNTCALPGCPDPIPLGCYTECPPELNCGTLCATQSCTCDGARWTCTAVCVDNLTSICSYP